VEDVEDEEDEDVDMEEAERRADERLGKIEYGKRDKPRSLALHILFVRLPCMGDSRTPSAAASSLASAAFVRQSRSHQVDIVRRLSSTLKQLLKCFCHHAGTSCPMFALSAETYKGLQPYPSSTA
jgi:hypothetical protein